MTTVAVLMPTKGRAKQMSKRVGDLLKQDTPAGVTLLLVLSAESSDAATQRAAAKIMERYPERVLLANREPDTTAVQGWNAAHNVAIAAGADWLVLGADDVIWHEGWLAEALRVAEDTGAQVVGLNDGHTALERYGAHYMAHRDFTETVLGGVMAPAMYRSWWFDREVCERAIAAGLYAAAPLAMAEHTHPDWGTAEMDATYTDAWHWHNIDKRTYLVRRAAGWPAEDSD